MYVYQYTKARTEYSYYYSSVQGTSTTLRYTYMYTSTVRCHLQVTSRVHVRVHVRDTRYTMYVEYYEPYCVYIYLHPCTCTSYGTSIYTTR